MPTYAGIYSIKNILQSRMISYKIIMESDEEINDFNNKLQNNLDRLLVELTLPSLWHISGAREIGIALENFRAKLPGTQSFIIEIDKVECLELSAQEQRDVKIIEQLQSKWQRPRM
jgi:hypothetical protein